MNYQRALIDAILLTVLEALDPTLPVMVTHDLDGCRLLENYGQQMIAAIIPFMSSRVMEVKAVGTNGFCKKLET